MIDELRGVVTRVVGPERVPADVDADTPLGEGGLWLDSVELLEIVVACETTFGITFEPGEDLVGKGLESLGTLLGVIRRRSSRP